MPFVANRALAEVWVKCKAFFAPASHTHVLLGDSNTQTVLVDSSGVSECGGSAGGDGSHAEGNLTSASGGYSHAEGSETVAIGTASHTEGFETQATGMASHAEGDSTVADGDYSHAQNSGTIAGSEAQTALGKYNVLDDQDVRAVIIGNGTSDIDRSNALTIDWFGNVHTGGHVYDIVSGNRRYADYTQTASTTTLGMVKVGNGLSIDANGVLSLNVSNASGVSF